MSKKHGKRLMLLVLVIFMAAGWVLLLRQEAPAAAAGFSGAGPVRLHILANSDSGEDQSIKLKVRDAVVNYLTPRLNGAKDAAEAKKIITDNEQELLRIARTVIADSGAGYSAAMETGWFDFPIRSYGTLVLPAGKYEAVRILLGEAQGKNWWCVLFPPLCFVDATGAVAVPANAGSPGQVTGELKPGKVEFRWKIVELWQEKSADR